MSIQIGKFDYAVMQALAEHRVLTNGQLALLLSRSERSLRGRLTELQAAGYLDIGSSISFGRGRPGKIAALTEAGLDLLKKKKLLPENISARSVLPEQHVQSAHHQALNDFRVCLTELPRVLPALKVEFLTDTSPLLRNTPAGQIFAADWLDNRQVSDDQYRLVPDGAFMIKHVSRDKALLFFLEIDMDTEPLVSATRPRADVRHKIQDYQEYFRCGRFQRYGEAWQCRFNGFRVLFVTSSSNRCVSIRRVIRANPPSNFIWVADQARLIKAGLAAPIWYRGGNPDLPETSILGPEVSQEIMTKYTHSSPPT